MMSKGLQECLLHAALDELNKLSRELSDAVSETAMSAEDIAWEAIAAGRKIVNAACTCN